MRRPGKEWRAGYGNRLPGCRARRHLSLDVTATGPTAADGLPVQLRFAAGPQPSILTADADQDIVPADAYLDVLAVIDSGIDFDAALTGDGLLTLPL